MQFDSTAPVPNFISTILCLGSELTLGGCDIGFIEAPRYNCETNNAAVACQGSHFVPNVRMYVFCMLLTLNVFFWMPSEWNSTSKLLRR